MQKLKLIKKAKNEFGFDQNATASRFVANRMSELFSFFYQL